MYKFVDLENLNLIKLKILDVFPKEYINSSTLFYIDNHKEIFSSIDVLKNSLIKLGIFDYVVGYGFYVTQPYNIGGIHTDRGEFNYSLNILLVGDDNSQVCFYDCNEEPIFKGVINQSNVKIGYNSFNKNSCSLIDSFYFKKPCIINVKAPHSVINNESTVRISFLIRLGNGYILN
jgi:hypothetical protein